jgi:SAM-dependent methyltransferase
MNQPISRHNLFLMPMLQSLPYFRALLRAVEADFYAEFELTSPVLDLGCGDGQFASQVFENHIEVGIDPSLTSLREAKGFEAYDLLAQSYGAQLPFPDGYFPSAFSNSVLEHITDLQSVLDETGRVVARGGLFLFCVPNHRWSHNLSIAKFLEDMGLKSLATAYVHFFTSISRHVNMLSPEEWEERLYKAGFAVDRYWHYFPPAALHALEWGHYFGLPSWLVRIMTGRWILVPAHWNLALIERALRKLAVTGADEAGTYTWYVARRN